MSKTTVMWLSLIDHPFTPKVCLDLDDECPTVVNHAKCWIYQPERGYCPWLPQTENHDEDPNPPQYR